LVHWPVINFFNDKFNKLSFINDCEILIIIVALTFALHYLIENPMRFTFSPRKVLVGSLSVAVLFIGGNLTLAQSSIVKPTSSVTIELSIPSVYKNGCHLDGAKTWPTAACTFGDLTSKTHWLLTGDSHAAQWFPAFEKIATEHHIQLTSITRSSCPTLFIKTIRYQKEDKTCQSFQKNLATYISQQHFDKIFISNFTQQQYSLVDQSTPYVDQWIAGTNSFIKAANIDKKIVFIQDTPLASSNTVACLTTHSSATTLCDFTIKIDLTFEAVKNLAKTHSYPIIQTNSWLCSQDKCFATLNHHNTYRDSTHISVTTSIELSDKIAQSLNLH
jgi:hypothetical protein